MYIYIKPLLAHKEKLFSEINMQQEKNTIQLNDADKATITKKKNSGSKCLQNVLLS